MVEVLQRDRTTFMLMRMIQVLSVFVLYIAVVAVSLHVTSLQRGYHLSRSRSSLTARSGAESDSEPVSPLQTSATVKGALNVAKVGATVAGVVSLSREGALPAQAIGNLYEFQEQSCLIQDVSFNVPGSVKDAQMFKALFQDTCLPLKEAETVTTIGFGPDSLQVPKDFRFGVTDLTAYGGHTTVTLRSLKPDIDGNIEIVDPGNGLQYIKVGAEQLRISKGIQAGAEVEGAYGWIDAKSPGGIPLEIVVGITRDPFMFACLRVSNLKESVAFFTNVLGMQQGPMPLARQPGSQYEPPQAKGDIFMNYGGDTYGLLLTPAKKGTRVDPGGLLGEFTILADDSAAGLERLPSEVKGALLAEGSHTIVSPDGYTFLVKPISKYSFAK